MNSNYYFVSNKAYAEHCWGAVAQEDNVKTNKVIMEIQISCKILSFFIIVNFFDMKILRNKRKKVTKNNYERILMN